MPLKAEFSIPPHPTTLASSSMAKGLGKHKHTFKLLPTVEDRYGDSPSTGADSDKARGNFCFLSKEGRVRLDTVRKFFTQKVMWHRLPQEAVAPHPLGLDWAHCCPIWWRSKQPTAGVGTAWPVRSHPTQLFYVARGYSCHHKISIPAGTKKGQPLSCSPLASSQPTHTLTVEYSCCWLPSK